jgi:uncharacterized protein
VWLPSGVADVATTDRAVARGRDLGLVVVADRDLRAEHRRWCP